MKTLTKEQIDRIKWQYDTPTIQALIDSHEKLRALLDECFKRAEFFHEEDILRRQCLEALEKK